MYELVNGNGYYSLHKAGCKNVKTDLKRAGGESKSIYVDSYDTAFDATYDIYRDVIAESWDKETQPDDYLLEMKLDAWALNPHACCTKEFEKEVEAFTIDMM